MVAFVVSEKELVNSANICLLVYELLKQEEEEEEEEEERLTRQDKAKQIERETEIKPETEEGGRVAATLNAEKYRKRVEHELEQHGLIVTDERRENIY